MPFKDDSPFKKWTENSSMDLENGKEIQKPLIELEDDGLTEGQNIDSDRVESEKEDHLQDNLVKHVHFSESLQRALEKKEWDEEHGLLKDDEEEEEEEEESTWEECWKWAKAETKCYANYICPVVLVNACILLLIIVYFWSRKN